LSTFFPPKYYIINPPSFFKRATGLRQFQHHIPKFSAKSYRSLHIHKWLGDGGWLGDHKWLDGDGWLYSERWLVYNRPLDCYRRL